MAPPAAPEAVRVHPGLAARDWLLGRIRDLKGAEPLTPVTVVVPGPQAGLHLRRQLATAGYANVRFIVLGRLAETLAEGRLAVQGRRRLSPVLRDALLRAACQAEGGRLADGADQAGVIDLLAGLAEELRRRPELGQGGARVRAVGTATGEVALRVVAVYYRRRTDATLYDEVDVLEAARAALENGTAESALRELGAIIVHLPSRVDAPEARLMKTLMGHAGVVVALADVADEADEVAQRLGLRMEEPEVPVASPVGGVQPTLPLHLKEDAAPSTAQLVLGLGAPAPRATRFRGATGRATATGAVPPATAMLEIAADPIEEVRSAVRDVLAALEGPDPVPLHRTAIVYRDEETYLAPLRDTLVAAGITPVVLGGRPLSDSVAARGLLGLIRLREQDFTRAAVLAWLSGLPGGADPPHRGGVLRNQAQWDRLSRKAGVVRGAAQWRERLGELVRAGTEKLASLHDEGDDPIQEAHRAAIEREIEDAQRIAEQVAAIDEITRPPAQASWSEYVRWALRLRDEFLTPDTAWTAEDVEASQMVEEVVSGLAAAAEFEPAVSVGVFLRALEDGLRSRRRPDGRMGSGVMVGPHRLLRAMDFDRVHILGAVESSFPAALPVDPLLAGDPLGRREEHEARERRDWLMALAVAGREVVISAPLVDGDGRAAYPSPWFLELLAEGGPEAAGSAGGRGAGGAMAGEGSGNPPELAGAGRSATAAPSATAVRSGAFAHPRLRHVRANGAAAVATALATPLHVAERRTWEAAAAHRARLDLTRTALAARDDLPLGRALTSQRARRGRAFTEFDGNAAGVTDLEPIARGLTGAPQSASGVETWATCPFRFLLGRVLVVAPTEEVDGERWWQIDPAERGLLIHRILQTFFQEVARSGEPAPGVAYGGAEVARIEAIAAAEFEQLARRGAAGHPLVWDNERAAILADLRTLLSRDAEDRDGGRWQPADLEQPFGFPADARSWPALAVRLPDGREVLLRGFIDRVDRGPHGVRVIDYKTGSARGAQVTAASRLNGGRSLQLPLYALAVRENERLLGRAVPDASAMYWYCTSRGEFKQHAVDVGPGVEEVVAGIVADVDAGIRAGCFPQEPGEYDDHWNSYASCGFCEYDGLCPAGRDGLAAAKVEDPALRPYRRLQPEAAEADAGDPGFEASDQ